jgi:hypothetical protein
MPRIKMAKFFQMPDLEGSFKFLKFSNADHSHKGNGMIPASCDDILLIPFGRETSKSTAVMGIWDIFSPRSPLPFLSLTFLSTDHLDPIQSIPSAAHNK